MAEVRRVIRRWRWPLLVVALLLVFWAAISLGGALLLRRALAQATGLTVEIADVDLTLVPPGIAVDGLRARPRPGTPPVLSVARAVIVPDLRDLVHGNLHVRSASLVQPFIRLVRDKSGGIQLAGMPAAESGSSTGGSARLDRVVVEKARIVLRDRPAQKIKLPRLHLIDVALVAGSLERVRGGGNVVAAGGSGRLRFLYAARGRRTRVVLFARLHGIEPARVAAYLPARVEAGKLSGRARYQHVAGVRAPVDRLQASLVATGLALRDLPMVPLLDLGRISASGLVVDLHARTLHAAAVSAADGRVEVAAAEGEGSGDEASGPRWGAGIGELRLARIEARRRGEPELPALTLADLEAHGLSTTEGGGSVVAHAEIASGGRIGIDTTVGPAAGDIRGRVELAEVALPPLVGSLLHPLQTNDGQLSGTLGLAGPPFEVTDGTLTLDHFNTVVARDDGSSDPAVAIDHFEADVTHIGLAPLAVELREARLSYPYFVVRREPEGLYPVRLLLAGGGSGGAPPPSVVAERLTIEHGGAYFEDRVVEPPYAGSLAETKAEFRGLRAPALRIEKLTLQALVNELAPLTVRGHIDDVIELSAELQQLPLPPLNPYIVPPSGYRAAQGGATVKTNVKITRGVLDAATTLVLNDLAVDPAGGQDLIASLVGVPTTLAIALMKDLRGRVNLQIPVHGNPGAPGFSMRSVILSALRQALLGALSSPLKLIGAFINRDDESKPLEVDPIPFLPGRDMPTGLGLRQIDRLAVLLGQRPALRAILHGRAGPEDVEEMRDLAILQGLGESEDRAIAHFLASRTGLTEAPAPELTSQQAKRLEALRQQTTVPEERLTSLARARAARVQVLLADRHVSAANVSVGPEAPPGPPAVTVELGAVR